MPNFILGFTQLHSARLVVLATLFGFAAATDAQLRAPDHDGQKLRRTPVVEVFEKNTDAVVDFITTPAEGRDPLLQEFFKLPRADGDKNHTVLGSGMVIHPSGYILTNAHVGADKIACSVRFASGKLRDAELIAVDRAHDLAIVKVDAPTPLQAVVFGLPGDVLVGETTIAIGNPKGLGHSCTLGIVAALGRKTLVDGKRELTDCIQVDTSANHGGSGGPLFNVLGEVIGVNTARENDAQSIGFAISAKTVRNLLPGMLDSEFRGGFVTGVTLSTGEPAKITAIAADSPAAKAGLAVGDVVNRAGERVIDTASDWSLALVDAAPGKTIPVTVTRDQKSVDVQITLAPRDRPEAAKFLESMLAIRTAPLAADKAKQMLLRSDRALVVTEVLPGKYEKLKDFPKPGDLLARIGIRRPQSLEDAASLMERLPKGQSITATFLRFNEGIATRIDVTIVGE